MPSSFSTRLRLEKQAAGENDSTWGTILNTVIDLIEDSISGVASIAHDDSASYSLTTANGSTDEARQAVLEITGALTAARNVVCPTQEKAYIIKNSTTGGFAVTLKTAAGTGISVPSGSVMMLYCDGTNVVDAISYLSSLTLGTPLPIASGGTSAATAAGARTALGLGTAAVANTGDFDAAGSAAAVLAASLHIANDLSDLNSAATARQNLGVEIGVDVQAYTATLASLGALTIAASTFPARSSAGGVAAKTISDFALTLLDDADAAAARATLGIGSGGVTDVSAAAPVVSSGGSAPEISMPAADAGTDGYMTSVYASKLDGIGAGADVTGGGTCSGTCTGVNTGDQTLAGLNGVSRDVGALGVGAFVYAKTTTGTLVAGLTIAGSGMVDNSGTSLSSGTWRNVQNGSIDVSTGGMVQRIA